MNIAMTCRDCDFRPGEAIDVNPAAKSVALTDYLEIANRHAYVNSGHRVVTLINGEPRRLTTILGVKTVTCDACFGSVPKAEAIVWDDLIICRLCSGADPCRCGHMRKNHDALNAACFVCSICTEFVSAEGKP